MATFSKCKECALSTLRISWSGLRTHEECKQRGYLQRTGKKAKLGDTRAFFAGTVTDRVVRDWLENDPEDNAGRMPSMVESIMERERDLIHEEGGVMKWKDREDRSRVLAECIKAVQIIEPDLQKLVLPFQYQADFGFKAPIVLPHPDGSMETVVLNGFMDILVYDEELNEWRVYDVKHTKDDSYWRKTVGQLAFYDTALAVLFGQPSSTTALLQPLCKETVKTYAVSAPERSQIMQRIVGMADDVWREDRTPRADMTLCNWCSVKHACTKFTPVQSGKNRRMSLL
jgi:hypothetical protein